MSKRVRLSCTTSPQVAECIEQLRWSGLWGLTRAEVIERLLCRAIPLVLDQSTLSAIADGVRAETEGQ